ncbi:hypothetical protein SAMN05421641_13120 [Paracoccus thiocyanatus]|uniref:Cell wall binding repeat-containing protein n=1 Tax=Paracoccus thiocyanatus TaxID=34006 RepID=A0A1N6Z640_9RHOB|nr:hypothetical protein [Paracoccus thiocyanatus]SIR22259.1 hypothetical protein SAMN05421641_13120 [Paracoccus thiocyanatus]
MANAIWYYNRNGEPAFYRDGDNAYRHGKRLYWISGGNWYSNASGAARRELYESGKWLFDNSGTGQFYRS